MSRSRADRRHHEEVMKARVRKVMKRTWGLEKPSPRAVGRMAHSPKLCSCEMCCNERRRLGTDAERLTRQELRDRDEVQFEIQDVA